MTLDSLSESSLLRLEQYFNSNPYREYSMNKPFFPKTSQHVLHSNRIMPEQQSSMLAFHELMDNQKNSLTLDRLAYKLRMKSDLNIDTLRETHVRRRRHHQNHRDHYYHHHQPSYRTQEMHQQHGSSNMMNEGMSSLPTSLSAKAYARQPTAITMSTNTIKTVPNDEFNGIEGSSMRLGTLDDLVKQFRRAEFRLVRRPPDYVESTTTFLSSAVSTNDRNSVPKSHQQHERPIKQPQALTEYHFNAPTFPTTPSRTYREPPIHQGLIYQYRNRERTNNADLPLLNQRSHNSSEQSQPRVNSLIVQERQITASSSHEKRVHELKEKSLMRTEKQLCVCNKLNIADPFNTSLEQLESSLSQLQQQQPSQQPPTNYIFPPVRPFGYFTKKTASTDDLQALSWSPPPPVRTKKKRDGKKRRHKISKNSVDSLDKIGSADMNNEENDYSLMLNDTIKSMISLTDADDDHPHSLNATINANLNVTDSSTENTEKQDES